MTHFKKFVINSTLYAVTAILALLTICALVITQLKIVKFSKFFGDMLGRRYKATPPSVEEKTTKNFAKLY